MTLNEILNQIQGSDYDHWEVIEPRHTEAGVLERRVWTVDPRIAVEFGRVHLDDLHEPWMDTIQQPDPSPNASIWVEVLLHGQPIFQQIGVKLDGGRAIVKLPRPGPHTNDHWIYEPRTDLAGLFRIVNDGRDDGGRYTPSETICIERTNHD